jgi:hypothetical protein
MDNFFYNLNDKLNAIRATPEVTHKQLNERDEGKPGKNFAKIAKDAGERYGSKAAGERVAGAVRNKLKAQGKLEEGDMDESAFQAAIGKKKYGDEGMKALQKAGRDNASAKTMSTIRNKYDKYDKYDEGVMDTVKSVGKKVASGINRLVGHGSDEDMIRDLQRKSGAPVTGKKPNFADKIANAKKEVDEMLGDVAAEAMRNALSPKQKKIDMNKNGKLDANDFAMLRKGAKPEMEEERSKGTAFDPDTPRAVAPKVGSIERGHKHDIKHTATGRVVTRRTDDQGNSVGADDDSDADAAPRGRGRPKGTKNVSSRAKVFQRKSKLMTKEGDVDVTDQGEYDQEGDMAKDDIKTIVRHAQALSKVLGDDDNLPEWVQSKLAKIEGMMISIDEYMQNQEDDDGEEEPIAEKAVSKQQQKFMGMAHAMQKGEKIKGASKELKKVAKTMKPKDTEDFAKTKHKGLPDKVKSKKKEEDVEESTTSAGAVATSTASSGSKGGVFGKGIYDSMNRELENMIAESMSINMSDSTEGGKSLSVTATDEDAMKLAVMLKSAGLGGQGRELQSDENCQSCGMPDCGCGDVQEAVDENSPDWPTNTETSDDALQYSGGLNKPKTDVAGDGQTTIPNTAVHTQDEDALRRMMEMAGLAEADKSDKDFFHNPNVPADKQLPSPPKEVDVELDEAEEDSVDESIQRMREMAGIKEAKKPDFLDMDKDGDKEEPMSKAVKDKEEKKVDESIFALTNQWKAYKG